jgi:hypothetical protein
MKTLKSFSILALIAVITFAFIGCQEPYDDGGGDGNNNSNPGTGNGTDNSPGAITGGKDGGTITAPITGSVPASVTDFSYISDDGTQHIKTIVPNSSITVSGGKVTINLGVPKTLNPASFPNGITVNPSDAKVGTASNYFFTSDGNYMLTVKPDDDLVLLTYADKDVTVKGQFTQSGGTTIFNMSLKAGWNYMIMQDNGTTTTATSYTSLPAGYNWQVSTK